jgi:hypothetical protein
MVTASKILEVEMTHPRRRHIIFKPLGPNARGLRCRIDMSNARTKTEQAIRQAWAEPIPGERLCIDFATGEKYIREPLHDEQFEQQRALILSRGWKLLPKKDIIAAETVATWVYHLTRMVAGGSARVVLGELPPLDSLEGEPRKSFIVDRPKNPNEKLTEVLDQVATLLGAIIERMDRRQSPVK